jgi:hypothetical protein
MLGIVRAHAPWRVRAAGASGHALARIVHRVIGLLHRVVRLRLDHCHHVSAYGATSVVDGRHSVWMTHVPRAQRRWQAHCRARSRWMCQRRAGRRSASGQCLKHHIQLLTCKRVYPRESMCTAGEARTHGACVTSVLCTRVLVCRAQGSEHGRGSGEAEAVAKPGARHALKSGNREIGKSGNREIGKPFCGEVLVRRRCC